MRVMVVLVKLWEWADVVPGFVECRPSAMAAAEASKRL